MTAGNKPRLTWIVPSADAGGVGPVALETGAAIAAGGACDVTLMETHAAPRGDRVGQDGLRRVALDMGRTQAPASVVLDWLRDNPQTVVFTNDVSHLHEIFPHLPDGTKHVAVLHDTARRYRQDVLSYARHLDGVVAVSDYVFGLAQKELRAAGFAAPIRRIHNGTRYPPPVPRAERSGPLKLLFIGDAWLKGGARLGGIVKALERYNVEFRLTVVTDEPMRLPGELRRVAAAGHVKFMPRCGRDALWRVYATHDVLLMLSVVDAFGMVTVEAMGMGCVPVGYDVASGTREIIESGVSGLLVPTGHRAIASAIAEQAASRARLQAMSEAAVRRARTAFTAARTAQAYVQFVEELTCGQAHAASPVPPGGGERDAVMTRTGSPLMRLYHSLPLSARHGIRMALSAHPASFRWLRERL